MLAFYLEAPLPAAAALGLPDVLQMVRAAGHVEGFKVVALHGPLRRELAIRTREKVVVQNVPEVGQGVTRVLGSVAVASSAASSAATPSHARRRRAMAAAMLVAARVDQRRAVRVGDVAQRPGHDLPQLRILVAERVVLVRHDHKRHASVINPIFVLPVAPKRL